MANPFSYEGKRVVVTGGYSGVGAALVELLRELGAAHISVLDLKQPPGPVDAFIEADLADEASVRNALDELDGPVHALFNNAGVAATQPMPVVLSVNYLALRTLSEGLLERMPYGAAIANTASIAGVQWPHHLDPITELIAIGDWKESLLWADAHPELVADPYSFSKECVQVYTMRSSRSTMRVGVRTNSVCPAPIDTPLLADFNATVGEKVMKWTVEQSGGTIATPRDIAMVLGFLGSDASIYVNGVNLNADGGFNAGLTTGQLDFSGLA
jgi:NAD(P)-dependent dehydrogenase (short-subunit alcohol dehydrogenase family)